MDKDRDFDDLLIDSDDSLPGGLASNIGLKKGKKRDSLRNLIGFWFIGCLNNFGYVVMLSAAKDLLEGSSSVPAAIVLLCDVVPTLIVKLVCPFFFHLIPYPLRAIIVVLFALAGFQLVAWPPWVPLRLLGVIFASISSGFGEITFLAFSSRFHPTVISTWSSGTGMAGISGSVSYVILTSVARFSPKISLLILSPFPLIILICFFFVLKSQKVQRSGDDANLLAPGSEQEIVPKEFIKSIGFIGRTKLILPLVPRYLVPLFAVYFAEYLINQGIDPVLFWNNSPFDRRTHYVIYQALYQIFVFISRSSVNIAPIPSWKWLYIPVLLQFVNLGVLVLESVFHFLPWVYPVFFVIAFEGLLGGAVYVNAFYLISKRVKSEAKEFSMGVSSVADSLGITLAGVVGSLLEPLLWHFNKKE